MKKELTRAQRRQAERLTKSITLNKRNGFIQMTKGEDLELAGIINLEENEKRT